jgi:hypothetical protein
MLVFIVPLKSRRVAKSWDHVTRLCERTLKSICGQTSSAFKAIVACHEKPDIDFSHPAVSYVSVDFPLPDFKDHRALNRDKYRKLVAGFAAARELGATHVMEVDADDCVSNRLAEWVERNPKSPGWFFDSGFIYRDGSRRIYRKRQDFYYWCGTSNIVRQDLLEIPERFEDAFRLLGHSRLKERLTDLGDAPASLPFPGAVYVQTKHGEANHHRGMLGWALRNQPAWLLHQAEQNVLNLLRSERVTPAISAEFGLYRLSGRKIKKKLAVP